MNRVEGIGLFFILLVGINAESADPWWVPHLLIILTCGVIVTAAYLTSLKGGRRTVKGGYNRG